jgi:hypothetical protein
MVAITERTLARAQAPTKTGAVTFAEFLIYSSVIETTALYLYYIRDCFAGFFRYALAIIHLDFLWFLPDAFAFICAALFLFRYAVIGQSISAIILCAYMVFSVALAMAFFQDSVATASGVKMILPAFVGLCFAGQAVNNKKTFRWLLYFTFTMTILGVVWNSFQRLPWEGFAYQGLGVDQRDATRLWWSGEDRRLGGFAADSTMAGYFAMVGSAAIMLNAGILLRLPLAAIAIYGTNLSTSKTSLAVVVALFGVLLITGLFGKEREQVLLARIARLSYLSILVPYILIAFTSGINLTAINQKLFSMEDRINNSWVLPFQYMSELFPIGYVTGCGVGCFNYPQQLFPTAVQEFWVPVDNFYMGTYLMFGIPFLVLLAKQVFTKTTNDPMKVIQTICMNLFGVTVLCYGPASSLIMFGILFSNHFASKRYMGLSEQFQQKWALAMTRRMRRRR